MNNVEEEVQKIIIALAPFATGRWRPIALGEED